MAECRQRCERNSPPHAANRPVRMAEKQVAHVMALDRLMKCFCLLELDQIHEAVPDVERRMVHEEENRSLGAVQLSGEPVAPLVTINPSRTRSSLECVE